MLSSGNICRRFIWFICFLVSAAAGANDSLEELELKWRFEAGTKRVYQITQTSSNQRFILDENDSVVARSPVRIETLRGEYTLKSLSDGNASGDLVLELQSITENDVPVTVPEEQKIPQRVAQFILTPDGAMEDFIGPRKETYIISRLILGLPVHNLKQQEVRVYPFQLFSGDTTQTRFTGTISHELKSIEPCGDAHCANIITTIDIRDRSTDRDPVTVTWKGIGTGVFNLAEHRLETLSMELAVKTQYSRNSDKKINQLIEIYTLEIQLQNR
jgi:hypothetical protein